jgi:hypothetical protein
MAKQTNRQTVVDITLQLKLKIEQQEPNYKTVVKFGAPER